jgi:hypothetical protein
MLGIIHFDAKIVVNGSFNLMTKLCNVEHL